MKKLLFAIGILFAGASVVGAFDIWISSNIAGNTVGSMYLTTATENKHADRAILHGLCVNHQGAATSSISFYNSSGTTAGKSLGAVHIGPIEVSTTTAAGCKYYDVAFPAGMAITSTGAFSATILYQRY